eukprot:Skav201735  [mRNA]  locus=scaffold2498:47318:50257:+ [translate_table: standard]
MILFHHSIMLHQWRTPGTVAVVSLPRRSSRAAVPFRLQAETERLRNQFDKDRSLGLRHALDPLTAQELRGSLTEQEKLKAAAQAQCLGGGYGGEWWTELVLRRWLSHLASRKEWGRQGMMAGSEAPLSGQYSLAAVKDSNKKRTAVKDVLGVDQLLPGDLGDPIEVLHMAESVTPATWCAQAHF